MAILVILNIVLILSSIKSIVFLKTYIVLLQNGIRTTGKVIAFEESGHIMTKGVIPKMEFQIDNNHSVIERPIYSWFLELNYYLPNKTYVAYYNKNNPRKFVIKSNIELLTNLATVVITMLSLAKLINKI